MRLIAALSALMLVISLTNGWCFAVDSSPQPATHPPLSPHDGGLADTNPPSMIWRVDDRAATYTLELSPSPAFAGEVICVEGIDMPFYNHSAALAPGTWYWRYYVVTAEGEGSEPSVARSFIVTADAPEMPVPPTAEILANLPDHPRIFVTPDTLDEFRARRETVASEAWEHLKYQAEAALGVQPRTLNLQPMPADPGAERKQVFYLQGDTPMVPAGYRNTDLNSDGSRANVLSLAWQISGDERYAEAARQWLMFVAPMRMDYHLEDRGQHDTVVYNYEYGLKGVALAYDRLHERLTPDERAQVVAHLEYHCDNAYVWCHDRLKQHLNYMNSHGQQCMHALLTTVMAVADETPRLREIADWLIRQYVNRLPWGEADGGYTEGQTYGHKFQYILEGLAALQTATGIDVFVKPRLRNAGDFWMYCMSLNYWWNHWGDVYSLLIPVPGASADTYIARFVASMTGNPQVTWWSDTVLGSPAHVPLWYLSSTGIEPRPPVDIAQARLFPDVGQIAAYDRFYDHRGTRLFFRSSPWGSVSHSHADQNGFVLHAGGEILAPEAGYYTYAGDTYHCGFSVATVAHNSILVNGEGQPKSATARGQIPAFLNSADYCVFLGDAAEAYPEMLERFDRIVLFLRPDVFVVYDELGAPEPSEFTWLLHSFEPAQIDEAAHTMTLRQSDQRLRVQHLAPAELSYAQDNARPFPMLTKAWCRYTEAFPQPYTIRVTTPQRAQERLLAVMDTWDEAAGPALSGLETLSAADPLAVRFTRGGVTETVLIRPRADEPTTASAGGVETDARVASVGRDADGRVVRWVLQGGTRLMVDGSELFSADAPCDASGQVPSPGAAALVQVKRLAPATVRLALAEQPRTVFAASPDRPAEARAVEFTWQDGRAAVTFDAGGESVLWVDPVLNLAAPTPPLALTVTDRAGTYPLSLKTAIAANGEVVAFGQVAPRESGDYRFAAPGAEILVQDRWELHRSASGVGEVTGPWREGTEVFVRFAPGATPEVTATQTQSYRGQIVNLLRNGGFEEGSPDYPPRTWVVWHPRQMGMSWPYWTQEDAAEGESCVKLVRRETPLNITSQPMRLLSGGRYVLRFQARGDATGATVKVSGQQGTGTTVPLEPGAQWHEYRAEVDLVPGYTTVVIAVPAGDPAEQTLWIDDMQLGRVAE